MCGNAAVNFTAGRRTLKSERIHGGLLACEAKLRQVKGEMEMLCASGMSRLFTAVAREVEGEDALVIRGALKDFRMAQRAYGVVIARAPVVLHAGA